MTSPVRIEIADEIATLTLDQPSRRNALSRALLASLRTALADVVARKLPALILSGAGGCFSAGADISELEGTAEDVGFDDALTEVVDMLRGGAFLAIAAVEGPCIGAAVELTCACDARVVSPAAFFELPAVRLGLLYNPAGIARLRHVLPSATMRRLLLLGDRIEGNQALAVGIATHMSEEAQVVVKAREIARRAIACPRAFLETKRFFGALEAGSMDFQSWQSIRLELLASPERRAAINAAKLRLHG
jgi:enoyl-CoA hydratase/carnithine racemase